MESKVSHIGYSFFGFFRFFRLSSAWLWPKAPGACQRHHAEQSQIRRPRLLRRCASRNDMRGRGPVVQNKANFRGEAGDGTLEAGETRQTAAKQSQT
jgi:hypothetical protein